MEYQERLDEIEEEQNLSLWEFVQCARAQEEALRLDREREAYFEEIYEDIRLYAVRYTDGTDPVYESPSVESQALEIIDAKNAYDLRIIRLKEKYSRWRAFLQMVDENTAISLVDHFERGYQLPAYQLQEALKKAVKVWTSMEAARGNALDQEAKEEYSRLRKLYAKPRKPKQKLSFYENGEWVLIDPDEYERQQWKKKFDAQNEAMRKYFRETFQHPDAL